MQAKESMRLVGVGIARSYRPEDLARKDEIERELLAQGVAGAELEDRSRALLIAEGRGPLHESRSENLMVDVGRAQILDLLIGANANTYTNATAALGVGDSAAAFAAGQTNLQGVVNVTDRIRKAMDASFPSRAGNVITWRATFATGDANFIWNEWAIFNNVTDLLGTMLNRAVANLGTKTSAVSWQFTVTLTFN